VREKIEIVKEDREIEEGEKERENEGARMESSLPGRE
jgi:hypothetical protein